MTPDLVINSPDATVAVSARDGETILVERVAASASGGLLLFDETVNNCRIIVDGLIGHDDWQTWLTEADWDANSASSGLVLKGTDNVVEFTTNGQIQGVKNAILMHGHRNKVVGIPGHWIAYGNSGDHFLIDGNGHRIEDVWTGCLCQFGGKHGNFLQVQNGKFVDDLRLTGFVAHGKQFMPPDYPLQQVGSGAMHASGDPTIPTLTNLVLQDCVAWAGGDVAVRYEGVNGGSVTNLAVETGTRLGTPDSVGINENNIVTVDTFAEAVALVSGWRGYPVPT